MNSIFVDSSAFSILFFRLMLCISIVRLLSLVFRAKCMIKIFRGGRGSDTFKPPPPYEQLLPLPTPCFKMFLEGSLNDPHPPPPHFKHPSLLPPPHPPPLPPQKKLLIIHQVRSVYFLGEILQVHHHGACPLSCVVHQMQIQFLVREFLFIFTFNYFA